MSRHDSAIKVKESMDGDLNKYGAYPFSVINSLGGQEIGSGSLHRWRKSNKSMIKRHSLQKVVA